MLFVLSITACEKVDNSVAIPTEETLNEGEQSWVEPQIWKKTQMS